MALLLLHSPLFSQEQACGDEWKAGTTFAVEELSRIDLDSCFCAEAISDRLFARIYGLSYKEYCTVPREELRYLRLLHYDLEGMVRRGELICHHLLAEDLLAIFRALFDAHYPIERMQLVDDFGADDSRSMAANNSSCFNFRTMVGAAKLSKHSQGMAIDINPLYNPYVRQRGETLQVEPIEALPYVDRSRDFPYKLTEEDLCVRLFKARGFTWGGDWRSLKDYQHFEK